MTVYIHGLMLTYLDVGITQQTYLALKNIYGYRIAEKIYLNNLQTIYYLLFPDKPKPAISSHIQYPNLEQINRKISFFDEEILDKNPLLLEATYHQINFFIKYLKLKRIRLSFKRLKIADFDIIFKLLEQL